MPSHVREKVVARNKMALAAAMALSIGVTTASSRAEDTQPIRIGVLTDMAGMYRDIMGPGSVTRAWSERFFAQRHTMPTMDHAAVYSGTLHYLQAVESAKTLDGLKVADEMRKLPVNDMYVQNGSVRVDGWLMHPFYMASIKSPGEVNEPWDYYNLEKTISATEATLPLAQSQCPLVSESQGQ